MTQTLVERITPRSKKAIVGYMIGGVLLCLWGGLLRDYLPHYGITEQSASPAIQATAGLLTLIGGVMACWGWVAMLTAVKEKGRDLWTVVLTFVTVPVGFVTWGMAIAGIVELVGAIRAVFG